MATIPTATTVSSPSMGSSSTSPLVVDRCLCGNLLHRPHQPPFEATSSLPPAPSNHEQDEENFSIYCSITCARQDALDSLNAKEKDLRHSASSSTSFASSSSSSVPMSASMSTSMSTSTWNSTSTSTSASESSLASSATSFSEQLGGFSSSSCIPPGLDPGQGEDNDQDDEDDECGLWEFVTPTTTSPIPTLIPTATPPYQQQQQHLQHSCISFKSHYQRVVERENALKEENGHSSSSPPFLSFCQPPAPPSSPATNVAPIPTPVAAEDQLPVQKRVVNASPFDGGTDDEEERARTPRSRGVDNTNSDDNAFSTLARSTPLPPSPPPSTTTTASTSTLTASTTSTSTSESDSQFLSPPQQRLKQKQCQPPSQTRTLSDIMRTLVDRDPGVLEHYQSQWAYPPSDWVRGEVVDYAKDDEDYDGEDSDTESDDDDEPEVPQREFSELERPLPPPPPSPIQAKLHSFREQLGVHPADAYADMDEAELGPCPSILPPNHPDELQKLPKHQVEAEQQPTPTLTSTTTMAPPRLYSPREVLEALALPPPFTPLSSCKESKRKGKKSASLAPIDTHAANHRNHSSCPNSGRLSNSGGSPGVRGSGRRLRLSASATSLFRKLLPISKVRSRCGSAASTKSAKGVAVGVGLSLKSSPLFSSLSSSGSGFGSAETSTERNKAHFARPMHQSVIAATSRSPSYSPFPSTRELKVEEPEHGEQDVFYDLRTPPMTATSSSSSSFMMSASTPSSTPIAYSPPFPRTPRHRSILDGMHIVARNPGYGFCPSSMASFVGERKSSVPNLPFPSEASSTTSTASTATVARSMPFPAPLTPRRHPRRRPCSGRIELDMDQSDEDDVRDPFRYDSMLFASAAPSRSPTGSSTVAVTGQSALISSRSPLSKREDENADEEEANDGDEDEEEDERRAWQILQAMRAAEFTYCAAAIGASASSNADD